MLDLAIALAASKFQNKYDKGGKPYILHCLHVMNTVDQTDQVLMQIAVMHDLIEDTDVNMEFLVYAGFEQRVIMALDCLTHRRGESYEAYIERVASNDDAIKVKLSDLRHNSDITRMKGLREKDFERLAKYHRSYSYLKAVLSERAKTN